MSITEQQLDVLQQLIELSYEKRLAITSNNIDALRKCTDREVALVGKLNSLTKSDEVPADRVLELARELKERNKLNDDLIKTHLEYVDTMINLLTPEDDPLNNFYGGNGSLREPGVSKMSSIMDVSV